MSIFISELTELIYPYLYNLSVILFKKKKIQG